MTSVIPEASTAMPDPRDQHGRTAVYRLYATGGTVLYIGISSDPDRRFKQHRDSKPWWPQVAKKTIEWHPTRADALAAEAAAIEAETPVHNIDHNPAAPSYRWPPAGMPTDQVDVIEREASKLPVDLAEGIRRAAFEGFTRARLADLASTPTDPTEVIRAFTADQQARMPGVHIPCHMYPGLCTTQDGEDGDVVDEDGRHVDHGSDAIGVPGLEVEGDPEIWAQFTHISAGKPPHVGFMGEDLTPEQARTKARELRQFADDLDDLADKVAVAQTLHDLRTVRATASPAFAGILAIVENAIVRDGADPTEVFERVLELMAQVRSEKTEATA